MTDQTRGIQGVAETIFETQAIVRREDRDRYVATLFAPGPLRPRLFALHAFDLALADVARSTTEPQIGMIRLAWWRDTVRSLRERPVGGQPVLAALGDVDIDPEALALLAEAHMDVLDGADVGESGARFFVLAAALLGDAGSEVEAAGRFWARANAWRQGAEVDVLALEHGRFGAAVRPVTALAAVARRDLGGRREPRGSAGRQFAVLRHVLTGRT